MNIDDVKTAEVPEYDPNNFIRAIFAKQHALACKYRAIEHKNGFWHPYNAYPRLVDREPGEFVPPIDDAHVQAWLKDMFWRATEEIAEALETLPPAGFNNWKGRWEDDATIRHVFEELADAVHFLAEASIVAGADMGRIIGFWEDLDATPVMEDDQDETHDQMFVYAWAMRLVRAMGLAGNCLKNKPWKSTQMPTDKAKFDKALLQCWYEMASLWKFFRATREDMYQLYFKKSVVNTFRQDTNY